MSKRVRLSAVLVLLSAIAALVIAPALAGGGHGDIGETTDRISTEGHTGLSHFLVTLYNDHRLAYALLVIAVMAMLGVIVGQLTELVIRIAGLRRH